MSTAALVGFVSSLVICIPLLTQLLGAILGIFGVVQTSGGRRRGRGLAIAAICISLSAAVVWGGAGFAGYTLITSAKAILTDTKPLFSSPEADLQTAVSRLRDAHFSARLKLRVDEQAVQDFARQVIARHGRLKGFRPGDPPLAPTPNGQGLELHVVGLFATSTADITFVIGRNGLALEIDNVTVGDLVLMPRQ
jgi:hypothetical protein